MAKFYKEAVTRHEGEDSHGFFIAGSKYMRDLWGDSNQVTESKKRIADINKVYRGTDSVRSHITNFLMDIINSQNTLIKIWIDYWVRKGFNPPSGIPTGNDIKQYYDAIVGLQGMKGTLKMQTGQAQSQYYAALAKSIDEAQQYYNPYTYIREAMFELINEGKFLSAKKDGTLLLNQAAIDQILNRVEDKISTAIMNRAMINMPKFQDRSAYQQQKAIIKQQYMALIGNELRQKIQQAKDGVYRLNKVGAVIKSNKKAKSIHLAFNPKGQASSIKIDSNEIIAAVTAGIYGDSGRHTANDQTRIVGSIVPELTKPLDYLKESTKRRSGKDDAKWDVILQDETHITIHISNKLYGRRDTGEGASAVEGLRDIQLQGNGTLDTRFRLIRDLIQNMGDSVYQKILFGIVNLHNQSLIHQSKQTYEKMLAKLFTAFMFNAQYEQVLDTIEKPQQHHIYLFNVEGQYYSLAEIATQVLENYDKKFKQGQKMIKVSITPASAPVMYDQQGGGMILSSGDRVAYKGNPFTNEDWYEIRNRIIRETKISAVRIDVISVLN